MAVVCSTPRTAAGDAHAIPDGGRRIDISVELNWGDADLRADWAGKRSFCSFQCAEEWLNEMAARHDQHVLTAGESPEEEPE